MTNIANIVQPHVIPFDVPLSLEDFEGFLHELSARGLNSSYVVTKYQNFRQGIADPGTRSATGTFMGTDPAYCASFSTDCARDTRLISALRFNILDDDPEERTPSERALWDTVRKYAKGYVPKSDGAKG